jgi:hypothetical protein
MRDNPQIQSVHVVICFIKFWAYLYDNLIWYQSAQGVYYTKHVWVYMSAQEGY